MKLFEHQLDALGRLQTGSILCGGVGSGKSLTALAYYYLQNGGDISFLIGGDYTPMDDPPPKLYIITTARKRDDMEWEGELGHFLLSTDSSKSLYEGHGVIVDSWNNIKKYKDVKDAFFIFDEQRVVGSGAWAKTFIKMTKRARNNQWILLSATPGDTWTDYIPVFVANGFYRNRTEFIDEHVIYSPRVKFPKIDRYVGTQRLIRLRDRILVSMTFERKAVSHHEDVFVSYDIGAYKDLGRNRWDPYRKEPIKTASSLCYLWRRIVNSSESRQQAILQVFEDHPKMIVFYNFDYELDILMNLGWGTDVEVGQWNGHKHQPIPESDSWVYLVQYTAGCEGWNCIKTDTIVFYSQNYSYKVMVQAAGRTDRLNTPYTDLHYFHLKSRSGIDLAISKALKEKKNFNETKFAKRVKLS